jgi:hypothetical protein
MSERDDAVDKIVANYAELAMVQVAMEFDITPDVVRNMIQDPLGRFEDTPEYDRYFEILDTLVNDAEGA